MTKSRVFVITHLFTTVLMAALMAMSAAAAPAGTVESHSVGLSSTRVNLGQTVEYFKQTEPLTRAEELFSRPDRYPWVKSKDDSVALGFVGGVHWLRASFDTSDLTSQEWVIQIDHADLKRVNAYIYENDQLIYEDSFGSSFPFEQRPSPQRIFAIPLRLQEHAHYQLIFRVVPSTLMDFPVSVVRQDVHLLAIANQNLKVGVYYGVAMIMVLYNLFLFITTRTYSYLYYVLFVISLAWFQGAVDGMVFQFLWPDLPLVNSYATSLSVIGVLLFGTLFAMRFLELSERKDWLYYCYVAQSWVCLLCYPLVFVLEQYQLLEILSFMALLVYPSFLVAGVIVWYRGNPFARYFTIAWSILSFFVLWIVATITGAIPYAIDNIWNWLRVASIVEMLFLAFALAVRVEDIVRSEQQAQALSKAKSDFIARVSHELRTPMSGIIGMANLMRGMLQGETERHYNDVIRQSGEALVNVLNDILDASKIEANKLEIECVAFDLHKLVNYSIASIEAQTILNGIQTRVTTASDVPPCVKGDPKRIRQILTNLLTNAVKFTARGSIAVNIYAQHSRILFEVVDSGIGLSKAERDRLFQPYVQASASVQRKFGGTGLGLYICGRLVELMHGDIGVISEEGKGSTFWFSLPLEGCDNIIDRGEVQTDADTNADKHRQEPLSVLVAEDNSVNQLVIKKLLEKHGHQVSLVSNGLQAVQEVINHYHSYHLILLDCEMPEMDGFSACMKIREFEKTQRKSRKPIIALTAHAFEKFQEKGLAAGMDEYLTKPLEEQRLLATLTKLQTTIS